MDAKDLKPCPMCGAAPKLIVGFSPIGHAFVDCECGMQTELKDEADDVVAMWNRRAAFSDAAQAPTAWMAQHRVGDDVRVWSIPFMSEGDAKAKAQMHGGWVTPLYAAPVAPAAVAQPVWTTDAARDVLAERERQYSGEGFTPMQDDRYQDGSLAAAAACYALHSGGYPMGSTGHAPAWWPKTWEASWWKPTTPRRNLVKAAALILAEIERLDRTGGNACVK